MNFEILVDGQSFVKCDLNATLLFRLLKDSFEEGGNWESTPATESQIKELLGRIDSRSVQFLRKIAASDEGSITWKEMREIFGIKEPDDWGAYAGSFGKGITRAFRSLLGDKKAKLISWCQPDWDSTEDWDSDLCNVYVDGPSLSALRAAFNN